MANDTASQSGFVIASDYRVDVLDTLADGPATPTGISSQAGYDISHVSRSLTELRERGLVDLAVPEDTRKGRIYEITEAGSEALEYADRVQT